MNTKELPKEIHGTVEDSAKSYAVGDNNPWLHHPTSAEYETRKRHYLAGATAWAKIAIGFPQWASDSFWKYFRDRELWFSMVDNTLDPLTNEQLFVLYIKTLPQ